MTTRPADTDPVRRSILAAMDRLFAGTPTRSTGRLSVSQLAVEAGVERWHLTHQHTDLKDQFQARVRDLDASRSDHARAAEALDTLRREHAELRRHCATIEERLRAYATALNLLMLENAALTSRDTDTGQVIPFQRRTEDEPDPATPQTWL